MMAGSLLFSGHEMSVQQGKDALSPSHGATALAFPKEQKEWPIMNGRPLELHGPPIHLFHQAFSDFQHTFTHPSLNLTANDYGNAHRYILVSAELYASEQQRHKAILHSLNEAIGFSLFSLKSENGAMPDGTILMGVAGNLKVLVPGGIFELKNEIGEGSSDPATQGSLSYRKMWVSDKVCCVP